MVDVPASASLADGVDEVDVSALDSAASQRPAFFVEEVVVNGAGPLFEVGGDVFYLGAVFV